MIDVIIPCYNAKKTISDTLFSIMYQNFSNFKVYLVNDAGKDNYDEEVEFFSNFFDIVEFRLEENRGPGYARDYGLKNTNSEYIVFIDSDDVLANPSSLKYLYETIKVKNYDFLVTAMSLNGYDFSSGHYGALHGKIFKRSFIMENNISFNYERYTSEDSSFIEYLLICGAKQDKTEFTSYILRNVNEDSIMHKTKGDKRLLDFVFQTIWAIEQGESSQLKNKAYLSYLINYISLYYYFNCRNMKISSEESNRINRLKKFCLKYLDNDQLLKENVFNQIKNIEDKDNRYLLFKSTYSKFKDEVFKKVDL